MGLIDGFVAVERVDRRTKYEELLYDFLATEHKCMVTDCDSKKEFERLRNGIDYALKKNDELRGRVYTKTHGTALYLVRMT